MIAPRSSSRGGSTSPPALYTAAQCRELDRLAIEEHGLAGFELMQRAGRAAFRELIRRWPEARSVTVCCGKGNNAGDGYIVAGLAHQTGLQVTVSQLGAAEDLRGDAARARDWALARGVSVESGPPESLSTDLVVDALLGTGIEGELREPFARTADAINRCGRPVLAIDIPTGVSADTGAATADAVRATVTVTFIGRKLGSFTGAGINHSGTIVFDDLGVPGVVYRTVEGCPWLRYPDLPARYRLTPREANIHKHALGHVVVVGGDHSTGGAVLMAAEAALRTGAGMVSIVTRPGHRPAVLARRPEVMVVDADDPAARRAVLDKARVLVVGPGLGTGGWGRDLLREVLPLGLPTVLDADGLNNFAALELSAHGPLVVTPHAGEAARLLEWDVRQVQADRPAAALALARRVPGAAVLKGAGSLVTSRDAGGDPVLLGLCGHGNPGMASAGLGDVQSGIIAGFLAQGLAAPAPACTASPVTGPPTRWGNEVSWPWICFPPSWRYYATRSSAGGRWSDGDAGGAGFGVSRRRGGHAGLRRAAGRSFAAFDAGVPARRPGRR